MADSLEEILDRATDATNIGDNKAAAEAFANQVNKEFDGPQRAIKLIALKVGLHHETVTLQAFNVLECCVQNCGQKFHQEIGKYRFLNELIKLLSPKYDGDITSPTVKDRLIKLMYSWYVGLPSEGKISEAYKMLKQQGIIKRDPASDSEDAAISRPRNTLEDEEKSQLLSTLLKSTNPEDLQAANKLIKTMVKQEEDRLEKFSKRVQELETVSNNVKLLNEMLIAYHSEIPESERETMKYLYESCLSMRTQLFRMASSSAEEKDDTLSEILALSDDLTKAVDEYKHVVIQGGEPTMVRPTVDKVPIVENQASNQGMADSLLDLGLDMDHAGSTRDSSHSNNASATSSLLDEQFKLLGLDSDISQSKNANPQQQVSTSDQWGAIGTGQPGLAQPQQQQQQQQQPRMQMSGQYYPANPSFNYGMNVNMSGQMMHPNISSNSSGMVPNIRSVSSFATSTGSVRTSQSRSAQPSEPKKYNDPLAFDIFSDFKKEEAKPSNSQNSKIDTLGKPNEQETKLNERNSMQNVPNLNSATSNSNTAIDTLLDFSVEGEEKGVPSKKSDTLSSDGYVVPLEAIEPTTHTPITALDKDGVKTMLNIVKDKRDSANSNVIVAVFSTISTNVTGISEFKIEISVPKAMRVKMQTPSSTTLPPFNPLFPPSAITQIILIANPSKDTIRMQLRISYKSGDANISEIFTIDSLPVT